MMWLKLAQDAAAPQETWIADLYAAAIKQVTEEELLDLERLPASLAAMSAGGIAAIILRHRRAIACCPIIHGGNTGSIPVGRASSIRYRRRMPLFLRLMGTPGSESRQRRA